jgi:hypothetical protein
VARPGAARKEEEEGFLYGYVRKQQRQQLGTLKNPCHGGTGDWNSNVGDYGSDKTRPQLTLPRR